MKKKALPQLLLLLFLFSCSEKKKEGITFIDTSSVSVELKGGVPMEINVLGNRASALQIIDTCLIAFNTGKENVFEVYSTNSHNKIGGFGKRGKGPGEFGEYASLTGQITFDETTNRPIVHVFVLNENKLHYVDLYTSLKDPNASNKFEMLSGLEGARIVEVIHKEDSLLYFSPILPIQFPAARMMKYNLIKKTSKPTPFVPEIDIPIREENKADAYTSVFAVNDKSKKIAAAPIFLGQVDFFDFNGEHIHSTNYNNFEKYRDELAKENISMANIKQHIIEMKKGNNAIYALNIDLPYESIRAKSTPGNSKVLKFDWDGKLLKEYVLDQPASSIAIDELHNRLYIFNPYNEDHSVWYYNLD